MSPIPGEPAPEMSFVKINEVRREIKALDLQIHTLASELSEFKQGMDLLNDITRSRQNRLNGLESRLTIQALRNDNLRTKLDGGSSGIASDTND